MIRPAKGCDASRIAEIIITNYRVNFYPFFRNDPFYFGELNVVDMVSSSFPPCFLMTAVGDFLREESAAFAECLGKAGVRCEYKLYGTENEPLGHVFHCNLKLEAAGACNRDTCDFFRSIP